MGVVGCKNMTSWYLASLFSVLVTLTLAAPNRTILVTGATGRTGSLVYTALQQLPGIHVRALIRNQTKARGVLHCQKCDASEGFWVGDVTNSSDPGLAAALTGADSLVIATGPGFHCVFPKL